MDSMNRPIREAEPNDLLMRSTGADVDSGSTLFAHDLDGGSGSLNEVHAERLGTDARVTDLVAARDVARRATRVRGALIEVAAELATGPVTQAELVKLLREPMAMLTPGGNVTLMQQDGDEFEMTSIHHGFGATAPSGRARLSSILQDRWRGPNAHVNPDVQATDIYCARVVAELDDEYRSVVVAAAGGPGAMASLMATHPDADGFDQLQIESLELTGRLVRAALYSDASWAERLSA